MTQEIVDAVKMLEQEKGIAADTLMDALQDALKSARGNRAKAARLLSTTERIFNYRVRKYGIDWRRFKA